MDPSTSGSRNSEDNAHTEAQDVPKIGMIFESVEDAASFYNTYAKRVGFGIRNQTSKKVKGSDVYASSLLVCSKEGFKRRVRPHIYERPATRTGCMARMRVKKAETGKYVVNMVELNHNHEVTPTKVRFYRSHKKMDSGIKKHLWQNCQAGIKTNKSIQSLAVEVGGISCLDFEEREARNFIAKQRRLELKDGDAQALYQYFRDMQQKYPGFYYTANVDEESRLTDVFWVDPRSRDSFDYFGDVVTFDTTYLTNKYDLKCALFVGVNHHGHSIMLGVGLIADETIEAFVWLFNAFMESMGKPPNSIITDQSSAIQAAVKQVFPDANYMLCIGHIMKKIPEKLGALAEYISISRKLKKIVYGSLTIDEFEKGFMDMINKFKLEDNDWLEKMYSIRNLWVPVYVKMHFFAGMSSTQRSEGINAFFDGFLNRKTTLKEFVLQYEKALDYKWNKEEKADFENLNTTPVIKCYHMYEMQLSSVYTREIFVKFQEEVIGIMQCFSLKLLSEDGSDQLYSLVQGKHVINDVEFGEKEYEVKINKVENKVECICHLFEHKGFLCRHSMYVLTTCGVREVPDLYILPRWTKDYKRLYFKNFKPINIAYSDKNMRVADLSRKLGKLAVNGGETQQGYEIVLKMFSDCLNQIHNIDPVFQSYQNVNCEAPSVNLADDGEDFEKGDTHGNNAPDASKILSPTKCSRVGRPKRRLMTS